MNPIVSEEEINDFIDSYLFDFERVKEYKKAKRLEQFLDLVGFPFLGIALYGTAVYAILYANHLTNTYLNLGATDHFSALENHWIILSLLIIAWIIAYLIVHASIRTNERAEETGIDQESYSKYKLSLCYRHFKESDYQELIDQLKGFLTKKKKLHYLNIFPIRVTNFSDISFVTDIEKDVFSPTTEKWVEDYIDKATNGGEIDEEYVDKTFYDFFGLLIGELDSRYNRREILYETITATAESEFSVSVEDDGIDEEIPSYFDLIRDAFGDSIPEIQSIWVVYLAILLIGLALAQNNGIMGVIVVSVLLSAVQIYERRF